MVKLLKKKKEPTEVVMPWKYFVFRLLVIITIALGETAFFFFKVPASIVISVTSAGAVTMIYLAKAYDLRTAQKILEGHPVQMIIEESDKSTKMINTSFMQIWTIRPGEIREWDPESDNVKNGKYTYLIMLKDPIEILDRVSDKVILVSDAPLKYVIENNAHGLFFYRGTAIRIPFARVIVRLGGHALDPLEDEDQEIPLLYVVWSYWHSTKGLDALGRYTHQDVLEDIREYYDATLLEQKRKLQMLEGYRLSANIAFDRFMDYADELALNLAQVRMNLPMRFKWTPKKIILIAVGLAIFIGAIFISLKFVWHII